MNITLDPNDRRCQSCADGRREEKYPRCSDCMKKLLAVGLCKWCGMLPRKDKSPHVKQSDYCDQCGEAVTAYFLRTQEKRLNNNFAKHRGPDHKERTRDTKFGTGH